MCDAVVIAAGCHFTPAQAGNVHLSHYTRHTGTMVRSSTHIINVLTVLHVSWLDGCLAFIISANGSACFPFRFARLSCYQVNCKFGIIRDLSQFFCSLARRCTRAHFKSNSILIARIFLISSSTHLCVITSLSHRMNSLPKMANERISSTEDARKACRNNERGNTQK